MTLLVRRRSGAFAAAAARGRLLALPDRNHLIGGNIAEHLPLSAGPANFEIHRLFISKSEMHA